jgi:hypothetical protein
MRSGDADTLIAAPSSTGRGVCECPSPVLGAVSTFRVSNRWRGETIIADAHSADEARIVREPPSSDNRGDRRRLTTIPDSSPTPQEGHR